MKPIETVLERERTDYRETLFMDGVRQDYIRTPLDGSPATRRIISVGSLTVARADLLRYVDAGFRIVVRGTLGGE
jgi:hypothetical protein